MEVEEDFGQVLRQYRKEHKITQPKLSAILNITQSAISQYETGKRTPTAATIRYVREKLNIKPKPPPPPQPNDYPELFYEQEGRRVKVVGFCRITPVDLITEYLDFETADQAADYCQIIEDAKSELQSHYAGWFEVIFDVNTSTLYVYTAGLVESQVINISNSVKLRLGGRVHQIIFDTDSTSVGRIG